MCWEEVWSYVGAHEGHKGMSDPLELAFQTFLNLLLWDLNSSPLVEM